MSTFLGIGLGPIQTGIFLSGACQGGVDRLVVAEVDPAVVAAVRQAGKLTINIAGSDAISQEIIDRVEIYNPQDPDDLQRLIGIAADAGEIATALPDVKFFPTVAAWLRQGFALQPERRRFIYTAENDNFAAEKLEKAMEKAFPQTYYLNTVIGKMSKACMLSDSKDFKLAPLCPGMERAHLVESFNRIYISNVPEIDQRKVRNLHVKENLLPFEEAKLYGHNAIHFMLGWQGAKLGLKEMHELAAHPELLDYAQEAFTEESGKALCRKWQGIDPLFTQDQFASYADDLLTRMVNPFLRDRIDRVIRDVPRKLDFQDRIIGTIQLCLGQQVLPAKFMELAVSCIEHSRA